MGVVSQQLPPCQHGCSTFVAEREGKAHPLELVRDMALMEVGEKRASQKIKPLAAIKSVNPKVQVG